MKKNLVLIKFGFILNLLYFIKCHFNEANYEIHRGKQIIGTDNKIKITIKGNINKIMQCASECLKKSDCNMALLQGKNCFIYLKCDFSPNFKDNGDSISIVKKSKCTKDKYFPGKNKCLIDICKEKI